MERDPILADSAVLCTQLEQLAGHRWDSHVLLVLAASGGPLHRTGLAEAITVAARQRIADSQLDRSLRRLGGRRAIRWALDGERGRKVYRLTRRGRRDAARLAGLVQLVTAEAG